jgi:hypothetical protein
VLLVVRGIISGVKTCSTCGEEKAETEYWRGQWKRKDGTYGLLAECKTCRTARGQKWTAANREKIRERQTVYREENRETVQATHRRWRERNPGRDRIHSNDWNKRNPKKVRAWVDRRRSRLQDAYVADVTTKRSFSATRATAVSVENPSWDRSISTM